MISHKHKLILVHVPRTGGTSIEKYFNYNGEFTKDGGDEQKHFNLDDYKKQLNDKQFKSYFKFSFVRNPWDIIISKYLHLWYANIHKGGEIGFHAGKSLRHFLDHYQPPPHEHGDSFHEYFDPHQMDFIGRFENRENDLKYISDKIGVEIDGNIHLRKVQSLDKKKKHYTEYYDDETKQIVAEKYAKDINYFGYKFGDE